MTYLNSNYCVYSHKNKITNEYYVGITCQKPIYRWGHQGHNYIQQPKFYNAIQTYGWDNFEHNIEYSNLSIQEAIKIESQLIQKYDSINNGYNVLEIGNNPNFIQVKCITTGQIYNSISEAASDINRSPSALSHCLNGDNFTCGTKDGVKLEWCYINNTGKNQFAKNKRQIKINKKLEIQNDLHKKIIEDYKQQMTITNIAKKYHKGKSTITNILLQNGFEVLPSYIAKQKAVSMYDLEGNWICDFESQTKALAYFGMTDSNLSRLKLACEEPWRVFKKHKWKYKT